MVRWFGMEIPASGHCTVPRNWEGEGEIGQLDAVNNDGELVACGGQSVLGEVPLGLERTQDSFRSDFTRRSKVEVDGFSMPDLQGQRGSAAKIIALECW